MIGRSSAALLLIAPMMACSPTRDTGVGRPVPMPTYAPPPLLPMTSATVATPTPTAKPDVGPPTKFAPVLPRALARADGSESDKLLAAGDDALTRGDFVAAEDSFKKAAQKAPKDPAPIVGLVRARLALKDVPTGFGAAPKNATLTSALTDLARALKLEPNYAPALLERGKALLVAGNAEEALKSLSQSIELDRTDPEAHAAVGVGLLATGDIAGATKELGRAAELDPGRAERHDDFGTALLLSGRVEEAIKSYQRAAELAPRNPQVLSDLGAALLQQNRTDEAIGWLEKATTLDPKRATFKQNLAYALHQKGQLDRARALYEEATTLDPKLISAWVNLGNLHAQGKRWKEARDAYGKAKAVDPRDPRVVAALSELDEIEKGAVEKP